MHWFLGPANHVEHHAATVGPRLFGLQCFGAERHRDRGADREGADLHQSDAGDVDRRGGREELLRQARRAEAGRYRTAQREALDRLEARRDLAVHRVAAGGATLLAASSEENTSEIQSL